MSRLPESGDVVAAVRVLNARMLNAADVSEDSPTIFTGPMTINLEEGTVEGEGARPLRLVYGDLFDTGDLMATGGADLIERQIGDVVAGAGGLRSAFVTTLLMGTALGVLMERHRWQQKDGES